MSDSHRGNSQSTQGFSNTGGCYPTSIYWLAEEDLPPKVTFGSSAYSTPPSTSRTPLDAENSVNQMSNWHLPLQADTLLRSCLGIGYEEQPQIPSVVPRCSAPSMQCDPRGLHMYQLTQGAACTEGVRAFETTPKCGISHGMNAWELHSVGVALQETITRDA